MPRAKAWATTTGGKRRLLLLAVPKEDADPAMLDGLEDIELAPPTPAPDLSGLATSAALQSAIAPLIKAAAVDASQAAQDSRLAALETKTAALSADLGGLKVTVASQGTLLDKIKGLLKIV